MAPRLAMPTLKNHSKAQFRTPQPPRESSMNSSTPRNECTTGHMALEDHVGLVGWSLEHKQTLPPTCPYWPLWSPLEHEHANYIGLSCKFT